MTCAKTLMAAIVVVPVLAAVPAAAAPASPPGTSDAAVRHVVVIADDAPATVTPRSLVADAAHRVLGPVAGRLVAAPAADQLVGATFGHALRGFILEGASAAVVAAMADDPAVAVVEAAIPLSVAGLPTGVDRVDVDRLPAAGLGSGRDVDVDVAVLDTGVDASLSDLRVVASFNCWRQSRCVPGGRDHDGHGTHVAGIVAARDDGVGTVGVAPGARLWSLKVVGGPDRPGSTADLAVALDTVVAYADQIDVATISLGGLGRSWSLDRAITAATEAGVTVVVAAGNHRRNARDVTPANSPDALTVSAISDTDGRAGGAGSGSCGPDDHFASYSNHGRVVDVAAPGTCIESLARGGGTSVMTGTSMAAPHVAGAVAQLIAIRGLEPSSSRAATVRKALLADWTTPQAGPCGFRGGLSDEPLLLLVPCGGTAPAQEPPSNPPPPPPDPATQPDHASHSAPPLEPVSVATVSFHSGRRAIGGRWVAPVVTIAADGQRLEGADVTVELWRDGHLVATRSGTTGGNGVVELEVRRSGSGCFRALVTAVDATGHRFDGVTPANEHCT